MNQDNYLPICKIIPRLDANRHKGQNGKIAIIGGSFDYTGAPYYAAISALKGGADLSYIFCSQSSAIPIKCYSPECIVSPLLQNEQINLQERTKMLNKLVQQSKMMSALVIGPGLGREAHFEQDLAILLEETDQIKILDADALFYLSQQGNKLMDIVKSKPQQFILTPNLMEIKRLQTYFGLNHDEELQYPELYTTNQNFFKTDCQTGFAQSIQQLCEKMNNPLIIAKGKYDLIIDGKVGYAVYETSGAKRCGGQGDILCGLVGTYANWAQQQKLPIIYGCLLASLITRKSSYLAYSQHHYSTTTPLIIEQLGAAFQQVLTQSYKAMNK